MDKTVREALIGMGATEAQLQAKVVTLIEKDMLEDEEIKSATVRRQLADMSGQIRSLRSAASDLHIDVMSTKKDIDSYKKKLQLADTQISEHCITDKTIIDGLIAFKRMLEAARDTFGVENMSEAVICKAIDAASYGYWRSVMGPKDNNGYRR